MTRKAAKTIDQIEQEPTFIFTERDAKDELPKPAEDKRRATKEFVVERDSFGLYVIKYTAGGEVPDVLKGRFTTSVRAQEAIDNVLVTRAQQQTTTG